MLISEVRSGRAKTPGWSGLAGLRKSQPGPTNPGFDPTRQYVGLIHYVEIFSTNQCLNLPDIE